MWRYMYVIEAENIRKSYGRKTIVLNGASFNAASGEYIAIVGANGCGNLLFWRYWQEVLRQMEEVLR